jgi:hypothetical protein
MTTPRYKKIMVGDGFLMVKCLADPCDKIEYPYIAIEGKYTVDPRLTPEEISRIKTNQDTSSQDSRGVWHRRDGGTKCRRRKHRNNSHKRRRSGSKFKSSRRHY